MSCCILPETIGAGLTFDRLITLTAYPADEWALTIMLRGPSSINLTATPEGTQHRIHADAATTATWAPGDYWYTARATRGAEVVEVDAGSVTITPDLSVVTDPYDGRSQAQIALEAIDAVLAKRATMDQERYRINNRELYRTPIAELIKLRSYYASQVQREKAAACGKNLFGGVVRVRLK